VQQGKSTVRLSDLAIQITDTEVVVVLSRAVVTGSVPMQIAGSINSGGGTGIGSAAGWSGRDSAVEIVRIPEVPESLQTLEVRGVEVGLVPKGVRRLGISRSRGEYHCDQFTLWFGDWKWV
jgi:hypothetical protein